MKVYVASSWRNRYFPEVVKALRSRNHEVYDFTDSDGFSWEDLEKDYPPPKEWDAETYLQALQHPIAQRGFDRDKAALDWADACVYVMPCGVSASLELGYAAGQGKVTIVYVPELREPDLMVKLADYVTDDLADVLVYLDKGMMKFFDLSVYDLDVEGRNQIVQDAMDQIYQLMNAGNTEYAGGENVFGNFVRLAHELGSTPEKVLWTYAMKHKDGIAAHIRGVISQREPVEGRIGDLITYLMLLRCMVTVVRRHQETLQLPCSCSQNGDDPHCRRHGDGQR